MLAKRLVNEQTKASRGSPKGNGRFRQSCPAGPLVPRTLEASAFWPIPAPGPTLRVFSAAPPQAGCGEQVLRAPRRATPGQGRGRATGPLLAPSEPKAQPWWASCVFAGIKRGAAERAPGPERGRWRVAPGTPAPRARDEREFLSWSPLCTPRPAPPRSLPRVSSRSHAAGGLQVPQHTCLPGCAPTTLPRTPVLFHSGPSPPTPPPPGTGPLGQFWAPGQGPARGCPWWVVARGPSGQVAHCEP